MPGRALVPLIMLRRARHEYRSRDTDFDDPALPAVADIISTGAAADSAESDERLKALPRVLRYAVLAGEQRGLIRQRLVAEIEELCPRLPLNAEWARHHDVGIGVALAHALDHRAVVEDTPHLRSLADCVRLLSLPIPRDNTYAEDHRRVAKALLQALERPPAGVDAALLADLEAFCFGWAALPACTDLLHRWDSLAASQCDADRAQDGQAPYRSGRRRRLAGD